MFVEFYAEIKITVEFNYRPLRDCKIFAVGVWGRSVQLKIIFCLRNVHVLSLDSGPRITLLSKPLSPPVEVVDILSVIAGLKNLLFHPLRKEQTVVWQLNFAIPFS